MILFIIVVSGFTLLGLYVIYSIINEMASGSKYVNL
jgi:hypothetical protein